MKLRKTCFVALTCLFLNSCNYLSPLPARTVSQYTISDKISLKEITRRYPDKKTLLVTTPIAAPGYETDRMVYVTVPYRMRAFAAHQWVAPPAQLLLPLIADRLRVTGAFYAVVTPPFSGIANYQLNTQLLQLQQEFLQPTSRVRLSVLVTLMQVSTGRVMASRTFTIVIPAPENNPYSGVLATNQAVHQLTKALSEFVTHSLHS